MKTNNSYKLSEDHPSLPPRRKTHSKPIKRPFIKKKWAPKHAKKRPSLIFKERPKKTLSDQIKQKQNKKEEREEKNPYILIRTILAVFIIMVASLIGYLSWMWIELS